MTPSPRRTVVIEDELGPAADDLAKRFERGTSYESHVRRVHGRAALYAAALAELRALAVAGVDVRGVGVDRPWPAAFSPLTLAERQEVVREGVAALERRRLVAEAVRKVTRE